MSFVRPTKRIYLEGTVKWRRKGRRKLAARAPKKMNTWHPDSCPICAARERCRGINFLSFFWGVGDGSRKWSLVPEGEDEKHLKVKTSALIFERRQKKWKVWGIFYFVQIALDANETFSLFASIDEKLQIMRECKKLNYSDINIFWILNYASPRLVVHSTFQIHNS